jgi:hypothetical protein
MRTSNPWRSLALLAFFGVLAFAGCGGGSASPTNEATSVQESTATTSPAGQVGNSRPPTSNQTQTDAGHPVPGTRTPAPGVPVAKGADNSIQTFGTEGGVAPREQAAAMLKAYLKARVSGDWVAACEATSKEFKRELAELTSEAQGGGRPKGCAQTLSALFGESSDDRLEQMAQMGKILSFRIRGDGYAYLIFSGPEGAVRFIAMADDNGIWKVNTPEPAEFSAAEQGSRG